MFADPAYLSRFGFIPGEMDPQLNPDGLPVGFAIDKDFVDPVDQADLPRGRSQLRGVSYGGTVRTGSR